MCTQDEPDRSKNLIFFGVEEPEDNECTVGVIENVMEDMDMIVNTEMIRVAERFCKAKDGKPLPNKVTFDNISIAHEVFKSAKKN